MKKLYFWSRLNFSKDLIPQKLGKFRQHWSSQKSRSEVDDVKDRVIKWRNFVRYSILYQLRVTYLQFPWQKLCLFFTAFFRNFLNFEKKLFIFFDPTNHNFFLPQSALWATFEAPFLDASTLLSCCTQIHPFTKKAFKGH